LDETGDISLLLLTVYTGAVSLEVEQHCQSQRFLLVELELLILEQLVSVLLNQLKHLGLAILFVALRKDLFEHFLIRVVLGVTVGVTLFKLGNLDIFGDDTRKRARFVAHDLFLIN
jgi:hypothetical protein